MPTAAIILAAGASTRLGTPKQLLTLNNETLLSRAIRTAREAQLAPILVILGANHEHITAHIPLDAATPILNPDWQEGMASSIRLGIQSLPPNLAGAIVMVCDQPAVTPTHLHALCATTEITASSYSGRKGVPAFFPAATFAQLLTLRGDSGARSLLQSAAAIPLAHGELDIDTPADLARSIAILSPAREPDS